VQATDDFTIIFDEPVNLDSCDVHLFEELTQLWRLVQRYGMRTPLTINVLDSRAICVRRLGAICSQVGGWRLTDETTVKNPVSDNGPVTFPVLINSEDANGNILKLRVQLATKPAPTGNAARAVVLRGGCRPQKSRVTESFPDRKV